jgi:hypothetical protein
MDYAIVELERQRALANALIKRYERAAAHARRPEWVADASAMLLLYRTAEEGLTSEIELANHKMNGGLYNRTLEDAVREWKAEADDWQKAHDAIKARMGARIAKAEEAAELKEKPAEDIRSVWTGTMREFVAWVLGEKKNGKIKAASDRQAVMITAEHYDLVKKHGQKQPLKGRDAWQSWMNKKAEGK